jgi:uncharacterized protein
MSPIQGRGAFASCRIPKGTRIIEYKGQRITQEEANDRYNDDGMERHHTFLFSVNDVTVIDAGVNGNDARFINHSCTPNCEAVEYHGRIFIEAICTIQSGEELTYDYCLERDGHYKREWDTLYACRCGTPNCRGILLVKPRRPSSWRALPSEVSA